MKSKLLFSLGWLGVFCIVAPSAVLAACDDGICSLDDNPSYGYCTQEEYESECAVGNSCYTENCNGSRPANICCTPGTSCPSGWDTWDYAYDAQCKVISFDDRSVYCDWEWRYQDCSAADRCESSTNVAYACDSDPSGSNSTGVILAGSCSTSCGTGCANGGWYKTCCGISGTVQSGAQLTGSRTGCTNGGGCSSGARVWGTSCSGCLYSVDAYGTWTISDCVTTPTTAPSTTPVVPSPSCENCGSNEGRWCAPDNATCASVGGRVISKSRDCYCSDPNTVYCCVPQDNSCPAKVNIEETYSDCTVNDYVEVRVRQDPRTIHGSVSCGCAYDQLDVKIVSSPSGSGIPYGYTVCTVDNDSCKQWQSCLWDITNMQAAPDGRAQTMPIGPYPEGNYVLDVFYGGHTPDEAAGNICSDPMCAVSDSIALGSCPIPTQSPPCLTNSCPSGTTPVEISLSAYNPNFENSYSSWTGDYGVIGQHSDCCPQDSSCGGSCCPNGLSTGFCSTNWSSHPPYSISNLIGGLKSETNYLVGISSWGARGDVEGKSTYQRPYLKLTSGSISSAKYLLTNNYRGGVGSIKPNGPWEEKRCLWYTYDDTRIKVDLIGEGNSRYGWWGTSWGASFDNLRLWECRLPVPSPTCRILGDLTAQVGEETQFCVTTENADTGSEIWSAPLGSNLSLASSWTNIRPKTVGDGCKTTTFSQPGTYHVNCNAFGSGGACTGNPGCPWGTYPYPGFTCSSWYDCGNSDSILVTVTAPNAWYQTQGGDVYGQTVATSIPSAATSRYFSLSSSWANSGLVSSSSKEPESSDFNGAQVSQTNVNWQAQGDLSVVADRYTYQYFISLLDISEANEEVAFREEETLTNPESLEKDLVVYSGDNMAISNSGWAINSRKVIAFINGNLTVNGPISVADDGFLALVVNGNLTINAGAALESANPVLQGTYIVDGLIIVSEQETEPRFIGEGIFFAADGFSLNRDLEANNGLYPAELFQFDPKYLFTAPALLRSSPRFWQELLP